MTITIPQLRAVEALARTGQFSRAAREIGVSQPTISAQVRAFELASPIRIFRRDGHSIEVAPEAEALLTKIRIALTCFDEVERSLGDGRGLSAHTLSIGFSAHRLIMPMLASFVRQHPDIRLVTRGGPSAELTEAVLKGDLDLASVSRPAPDPRLACFELARCRIVIYGRKGHPRLQTGRIALGDLDGEKMVLWNRLSGTRKLIDHLAEKARVTLDPAMEVATLDVAYAAAAAGIGLAVAVEGEVLADDDIDIAVMTDPASDIGHYLVTLPECVGHAAIAAFLKLAPQPAKSEGPARF